MRMSVRRAVAVVAVVSGATLAMPARAQQVPSPAQDCTQATSNVEMTACAGLLLRKNEAELAETLKMVTARIDKADNLSIHQRRDWKRALREAQRHWLAYRKKDCGEMIGWEWHGGTGMALASINCEIAKVQTRKDELTQRYLGR